MKREEAAEVQYTTLRSPIGQLTLFANKTALVALSWESDDEARLHRLGATKAPRSHPVLKLAAEQLGEYFKGTRTEFDIPLSPEGTDFQRQVWRQLLKIPYGKHMSYGEQAKRIGKPKAARAVGGANGKNPIGIIIPCHRVIGATGQLTGFGGGLEVKRQLLMLEGAEGFKTRGKELHQLSAVK